MIKWHYLIGTTLTDYFTDTRYEVIVEKDLSVKPQYLDVILIEKKEGNEPEELPDGLEGLSKYNLITYKSHQESLDGWTMDELTGHWVNCRKQFSPSSDELLPENAFKLVAVSTRYPYNLEKHSTMETIKQGVYQVKWGSRDVRLIVLSRIPEKSKNAVWLMFSAEPGKVKYGAENYRWKQPVSSIMNQLFHKYNLEGVAMPYTIQNYLTDVKNQVFSTLTDEDIPELQKKFGTYRLLESFKPEDISDFIQKSGPEKWLKDIKPEDRLKGLKPEEIKELLKKFR